jgi:hypothetical protein
MKLLKRATDPSMGLNVATIEKIGNIYYLESENRGLIFDTPEEAIVWAGVNTMVIG